MMEELFVWAIVELLDSIVDRILEKDLDNIWRSFEEACVECGACPHDISDSELDYIENA